VLVGLRNTNVIFGNLIGLINGLNAHLILKGKLNKRKSLIKSFFFLEILLNINKRNFINITDKKLIHE
jgi:hypothetical protein